MPISTATIRSKATVTAAVSTSTTASERVAVEHRAHVVGFDHANGGDHQHAGEGGERDLGDQLATEDTTTTSTSGVDDGGDAGAGAGADVDRGAGDRTGGRHAAEQRRGDVGESLTEQLAVGIVSVGVGHAVGDLGRQQAFDRSEQRRPRTPGRTAR